MDTKRITVNTQSSIRIEADHIIYFDPLNISGEPKDADIVFITHDHYDHFSPEDLKKIKKANTRLVVPKEMHETALVQSGFMKEQIITVEPYHSYLIEGYPVTTIPAYNVEAPFHPKDKHWCGYVITIDGTQYYIAGDTDYISENKKVLCDIALIPIGGTYTMDVEAAANLANAIRPKVIIPTHYGSIVGDSECGLRLQKAVSELTKVVLKI